MKVRAQVWQANAFGENEDMIAEFMWVGDADIFLGAIRPAYPHVQYTLVTTYGKASK